MSDQRSTTLFEGHWWTRAIEAEQAAMDFREPTKDATEAWQRDMGGLCVDITWYQAIIFYAQHAMDKDFDIKRMHMAVDVKDTGNWFLTMMEMSQSPEACYLVNAVRRKDKKLVKELHERYQEILEKHHELRAAIYKLPLKDIDPEDC